MIKHTHEKIYKVREGWDSQQTHYYDITYQRAFGDEKHIRFYLIEHYLQFIDLLHEAHYYAPADTDPYS